MIGGIFYPESAFWSKGKPIPKAINFIWVGDKALSERHQLNILMCLLQNKANYAINLWVNPDYFTDRDNPKYAPFRFLESQGVRLRNYKDLAPSDAVVSDVLLGVDKLHKERPVVAADLLRLTILYEEGGYYMDVDNHFLEPMPTWQVRFLHGKQLMFEIKVSGPMNTIFSANNSFIAAAVKSPELKKCLEMVQDTLKTVTISDIKDWGLHAVLSSTGPGLLEAGVGVCLPDSTAKRVERLMPYAMTNYDSLRGVREHTSDATWLDMDVEHREKLAAEERRAKHVLDLWKANPRTDLAIAYTLDLARFYEPKPVVSVPARGTDALGAVAPWAAVTVEGAGSAPKPAVAPKAAAGAGGLSGPAALGK